MRNALCTIAFGLTLAASAHAFDMHRINGKIVERSMTSDKVLSIAGQPDEITKAVDIHGVNYGEFWFYRERDRTIRLLISGGAVADIDETKR